MATIQKRGNSYRIRVSSGYDINGKQLMKSMTCKPPENMTPKQIEKELARQATLFEEGVKSGQHMSGDTRFMDFVERWFTDYAAVQLRPKTIEEYRKLTARTYQAIGHLRLDRIQPHHLLAFYKNLAEPGMNQSGSYKAKVPLAPTIKDKVGARAALGELTGLSQSSIRVAVKGEPVAKKTAEGICTALGLNLDEAFQAPQNAPLSPNSIKHYHTFISTILERAVKWGLITSNPCRRVDAPKIEQKKIKYLNEDEAARMLDALEKEPLQFRAMFMLFLYTGLRRSELLGLEWRDIDFGSCVLSVNRTSQYVSGKGIYTDDTKTQSSNRSIRIPKDLTALLRQLKKWHEWERQKSGDLWIETDRIFKRADGGYIHPDTPHRQLQEFLKRHSLPQIGIHGLRHTSATLLIGQNVNARAVSGRLGHAQTSTTLNIYSHQLKSADAAASEALELVLNRSSKA